MTVSIIKICGLNDAGSIAATARAGATHAGFMFFDRSPRHVTHEQAQFLSASIPASLARVAVLVDPTDEDIDLAVAAIGATVIQLHGHETPERVAEVKDRTGLIVFKAVPVSTRADIEAAAAFTAADTILFDAKPPVDATRPGGHGATFDWTLLKGLKFAKPWILSGGLNVDNVAEAVRITGATGVDVSSGVEAAPGVKSPRRIVAFTEAALNAHAVPQLEPSA